MFKSLNHFSLNQILRPLLVHSIRESEQTSFTVFLKPLVDGNSNKQDYSKALHYYVI